MIGLQTNRGSVDWQLFRRDQQLRCYEVRDHDQREEAVTFCSLLRTRLCAGGIYILSERT